MPAAPATSDDHKKEGNELFAKGDFLRAAAAYTRGIKAAPDSHVLYSNRAQAFLRLHKVGKALEDADRCIALAPDFVKGYHRKASALHALGEPARSEEASGLATPPSLAILPAASASRLPLTPASLAGSLAALTPPPSPHVLPPHALATAALAAASLTAAALAAQRRRSCCSAPSSEGWKTASSCASA